MIKEPYHLKIEKERIRSWETQKITLAWLKNPVTADRALHWLIV